MGNTSDQLAYRDWLKKDLAEYRQAIAAGRQLQSVTFGSNRPQYQQYALIVYRGPGGGTAW
jgi:hypothetical protein